MNIYVLRHLQTPYNQTGTISGRSLNLPISTASPIYHTAFFDAIFCSSALRCIQTVELLSPSATLSTIQYCDELQERDLGILEGIKKNRRLRTILKFFLTAVLTCLPHLQRRVL